jgi:hypothetical protein
MYQTKLRWKQLSTRWMGIRVKNILIDKINRQVSDLLKVLKTSCDTASQATSFPHPTHWPDGLSPTRLLFLSSAPKLSHSFTHTLSFPILEIVQSLFASLFGKRDKSSSINASALCCLTPSCPRHTPLFTRPAKHYRSEQDRLCLSSIPSERKRKLVLNIFTHSLKFGLLWSQTKVTP